MKKSILLLFVFISMHSYGQEASTTTDQKTPLEKVAEFNPSEFRVNHNNEIIMDNPLLGEARTLEDSLALAGKEVTINVKYVRMDPGKVEVLFPETVTVDANNNSNIDYLSFIPILLEALNEQQKIIDEMELRMRLLETVPEK